MRKILPITALSIILALPALASVQGKLAGVVMDEAGNPVQGVTITIISMKMSSRQYKTKSDEEGKFTQIGLWPEFYQVAFKKDGFLPISKEVRIRIDETSRLEVTLRTADAAIQSQLSEADRLFLKGNKLYTEGKYEEAADAFREAAEKGADQWAYHFNLGLAHKKAGGLDEAAQAFAKAVELNPESFSCNTEMGEALGKAKRFEEARPYYEKAVAINADDADTNFNYGMVLVGLGESQTALPFFLKTAELQEDFADAYYQMGTIYIGQNNTPEAVAALEKFLELAPEHAQAPIAKQLLDYLKKRP